MKLGVRLESLGLPLRSALNAAAKAGAAGVQVDAAGDLAPGRLSQSGRREFRNLLRSLDLELTALGCPLRRGLDAVENLQERIEHVRGVMSLSYDLGARVAIVDMPRIPEERPEPAAPAVSAAGLLLGAAPQAADPARLLRESLGDLGSHGDRTGTALALDAGLDAPEKLAAYLATFRSGALGVNYDPASMRINGHDPIAGLTPLHERILHVRARDARGASAGRGATLVALGAGDIDWMSFVAVLDTIGYRRWLVVDQDAAWGADEAAAALGFLRRFVRPG